MVIKTPVYEFCRSCGEKVAYKEGNRIFYDHAWCGKEHVGPPDPPRVYNINDITWIPKEENKTEYAWVIESDGISGVLMYWTGQNKYPFISDNMSAVRFARQEDADVVANNLLKDTPTRIVEHGWGGDVGAFKIDPFHYDDKFDNLKKKAEKR